LVSITVFNNTITNNNLICKIPNNVIAESHLISYCFVNVVLNSVEKIITRLIKYTVGVVDYMDNMCEINKFMTLTKMPKFNHQLSAEIIKTPQ